MRKKFTENIETEKIAQLARKYTAEGYEVFADLPNYSAPEQIGGITPDMVVKKGGEVIIIEVKTPSSIKKAKDTIAMLTRYAREIPGARFDLVMTSPKPASSVHSLVQSLEAELYSLREGLLVDIKQAVEQNRTELALIISFRLLEGLLARLAVSQNVYVPLGEWNLANISRRLASEKVISASVLQFALNLYNKRNSLVHAKGKKVYISSEEAADIFAKLDKLISQWGGAIKMSEVICPVCQKAFNSYLNLARHMVLKDRPDREHIQYLERLLHKPFVEFGWKSDREIANTLKNHLSRQK